jgi:hypothetical protein
MCYTKLFLDWHKEKLITSRVGSGEHSEVHVFRDNFQMSEVFVFTGRGNIMASKDCEYKDYWIC